jgi:hypothetical protein
MSTTVAKPRMRISDLSAVVDGSLLTWLAHVGRIEGLTRIESAFALHLAGQLAASGIGTMAMSLEAIAHAISSQPMQVRRAIDGLIRHGVFGFTPGYGPAPSTFHMALPQRIAAPMSAAVVPPELALVDRRAQARPGRLQLRCACSGRRARLE